MRRALALARRGYGYTSPNPMVGAVLVKNESLIGEGWHQKAGEPHAEINAMISAQGRGHKLAGATLYVTLEPCSTFGRTPPCTEAILASGIKTVVVGTVDPNPKHAGRGLKLLEKSGISVRSGVLEEDCRLLNESFNHWIVTGSPFVRLKCAMSLDGKIATRSGASKWITSGQSRREAMRLRRGADAILVGINTILADDPSLTLRPVNREKIPDWKRLRRIVLDPEGRVPLTAKILTDEFASLTTVVVSSEASKGKTAEIEKRAKVWRFLGKGRKIDLSWLLEKLGQEQVTSLLVEGGGETAAAFLEANRVNRIAFFYAPKIIGGRTARKAVGGTGFADLGESIQLRNVEWKKVGPDLLLNALVKPKSTVGA